MLTEVTIHLLFGGRREISRRPTHLIHRRSRTNRRLVEKSQKQKQKKKNVGVVGLGVEQWGGDDR